MKKILLLLSAILIMLSCSKVSDTMIVDLARLSADYEVKDGETLTGILGEYYKITIADGATVTLNSAVIYGANEKAYSWAGITALGDATLILAGTNIVKGFYEEFPGIFVPEGRTLTIKGEGKLDVSSSGYCPGIGSEGIGGKHCGNIVIQGGTIRACGGEGSAAIGSGWTNSCGDITLSGGTVTATGGESGAGIGSGSVASCGNIIINGGTVMAEGGISGAGVGCGQNATCGTVSIIEGSVTAKGGSDAAGIGSGDSFEEDDEDDDEDEDEDDDEDDDDVSDATSICGDITISGGTVVAKCHSILSAAAIGSGRDSRCGNILISGGTVSAEGGYKSAGIGTSERGSVGNITITSGVTQVLAVKWDEKTPHSIGGGIDYVSIGIVTVGGKEGPVSESPFIYKP